MSDNFFEDIGVHVGCRYGLSISNGMWCIDIVTIVAIVGIVASLGPSSRGDGRSGRKILFPIDTRHDLHDGWTPNDPRLLQLLDHITLIPSMTRPGLHDNDSIAL